MNKSFDHVMVDLETMGNISYSSIVSIGAVEFDINTGETGREFEINVSLQSCLDLGLIVNGSTIMWWLNNDDKSRQKLQENPQHLAIALNKFQTFLLENPQDVKLWGNSNRFDLGLLHNAYTKCDIQLPWNHRYERDVRTLSSFAPDIKKRIQTEEGVAHTSIADCKQQIRYCVETWNKLNK